ncbi:hypothetical protein [Pararobbsia silviterrae]|uniref:Uncharacterized protein n=1 Tax=Pararobbsia silviterrae TaxID=1792498 RepID=A0A494XZ78_9BURK|nr:hypothetical protein [Pararobbsia silviterrae]RKP55822.1 hypothetical protein D7S86_11455 [Pararobbsia silviterrae]
MLSAIETPNVPAELDRFCQSLFDTWCERRYILPLAYLMQAWPIMVPCHDAYSRLHLSLHALLDSYCAELPPEDQVLIRKAMTYAQLCFSYRLVTADVIH